MSEIWGLMDERTLQQKLEAERDSLASSIKKLDAFFHSQEFKELQWYDKHLLILQSKYMANYLSVLDERIERLV